MKIQLETRSSWVDYAKAIGIILVVYGHVARGLYNAGINIPRKFYELTDSIVYSFHMPLFFFLSGFFFYKSFKKRGGIKLIGGKIDVIFYPYIIWSVLQGCIEVFLSDYTNGNVTYSEVFSLLWSPRAQFWFLYDLFIIFIVSTVIFTVLSKRFTLVVLLISSILYVYQDILPAVFISNNLVFFISGIFFSLHYKCEKLSSSWRVFIIMLVFIAGQFVFHQSFGLIYTDKGLASLTLSLVSIIFVISLSSWASKTQSKAILLIGSSSMAIYLMHILVGSGVRVILKSLIGIDSFVVHLIVGCCVGVCLPVMAFAIIKNLKTSFVLSAPISSALIFSFNKIFRRSG